MDISDSRIAFATETLEFSFTRDYGYSYDVQLHLGIKLGSMDNINYQGFIHASYPGICCHYDPDPYIFVCKKMDVSSFMMNNNMENNINMGRYYTPVGVSDNYINHL